MTVTVEAIRTRMREELKEPKNPPEGTWLNRCKSFSIVASKKEDGDPCALFVYDVTEPQDDVSPVELEVVGDAWEGSSLFKRFYIQDKRDEWAVWSHIEMHGIDITDYSQLAEVEDDKVMENAEVFAFLFEAPRKDGNEDALPYLNGRDFTPVSAI